MLGSLLILLAMPLLDDGRGRGDVHRPVSRIAFWVFVGIFFLLMFLGSFLVLLKKINFVEVFNRKYETYSY